MEPDWLTEAVLNNAHWCDAVAASHGLEGRWAASVWSSNQPMPRFYPNIITLTPDAPVAQTIDALKADLPSGWGIKDSFAALKLAQSGFTLAFDAHWYCCLPDELRQTSTDPELRVDGVRTEVEFDRWVSAWGEGEGIFRFQLLENEAVELIYAEREGQIEAGLAANVSGSSVGISNAFGAASAIQACIAAVAARNSTKAVVGYGGDAELASLATLGFRAIGDLRIWLCAD